MHTDDRDPDATEDVGASDGPVEMTVEYESRALAKLANAARHFESVERSGYQWFQEAGPFLAPARIAPDAPEALEIFEPPQYEPPLARWEDGFVDGVHNLRAALDAFVMELAHLDGVPSNEGAIKFPIKPEALSSEEQDAAWARVERSLRTVPKSLNDRLRALQTWSHPDTITPDFLDTLAAIDNDDKHRFGVEIYTVPLVGPTTRATPVLRHTTDDIWGRPWLRVSLSPPPSGLPALLHLDDIVPFVAVRGKIGHLLDVQLALHADTERCIQFLATGVWPPKSELEWCMPGVPLLVEAEMPNMRRVAALESWRRDESQGG